MSLAPYREMELVSLKKNKPRPFWKTFIYRFLIWSHGNFKSRHPYHKQFISIETGLKKMIDKHNDTFKM